jgi:hypothetical protein
VQKSLPVATAGGSQRPSCCHGVKCYRESATHKAEYAHVGDEDYQCSERTASSVVDLTGAEDKSPAAATDDARRTASSVVEKIEVTDISRRLQGLKKSDLKQEARLLGVQQADLDLLSDVDNVADEVKALIKVVVELQESNGGAANGAAQQLLQRNLDKAQSFYSGVKTSQLMRHAQSLGVDQELLDHAGDFCNKQRERDVLIQLIVRRMVVTEVQGGTKSTVACSESVPPNSDSVLHDVHSDDNEDEQLKGLGKQESASEGEDPDFVPFSEDEHDFVPFSEDEHEQTDKEREKVQAAESFTNLMAMEKPSYCVDGRHILVPCPRHQFSQRLIEDIAVLLVEYWPAVDEWIQSNKPTPHDFAGMDRDTSKNRNKTYGQECDQMKNDVLGRIWPKLQSDSFPGDSLATLDKKAKHNMWMKLRRLSALEFVKMVTLPHERIKIGRVWQDGQRTTGPNARNDTIQEVPPLELWTDILWDAQQHGLGVCTQHSARGVGQVVWGKYFGLSRDIVRAYAHCMTSSAWRAPKKPKPGNTPIRSSRVMERVQIDLIVLTSALPEKNDNYKYIMTVKDHFSRFVWLVPMRRKNVASVVAGLRPIFDVFGCPTILQSDNGGEFKQIGQSRTELERVVNEKRAKMGQKALPRGHVFDMHQSPFGCIGFSDIDLHAIVTSFKQFWPTMVQVHGAVNASSTQGSVENANQHVQQLLYEIEKAWTDKHPADAGRWVIHLSTVAKLIVSKFSWNGKVSPFEVMFNRPSAQQLPPGVAQLSDVLQQSLQTITQLDDTVQMLPNGSFLLQRLWARPIEGASNSLLGAFCEADRLLDYQRYLRANCAHQMSAQEVDTVLQHLPTPVRAAATHQEPAPTDVKTAVAEMVLAVASVATTFSTVGSVSGFTTNFNVLFSLQLKENVRVLGDGNCMADAFLKTAHVGQAVMCVMPTCPSSIAEFRTALQAIARTQWSVHTTGVGVALPWRREHSKWQVGGLDGHDMEPPQTMDAYCKFLETNKSWLGQAELELAAHLLPPSSRLFTLQRGQCVPTHIRRAGYRQSTERVVPCTPEDCKPEDVVLVYDGVGHWTATSPTDWAEEWPLETFANNGRPAEYRAMLEQVIARQDKQAVRMRHLAQNHVIGPYDLLNGMLVRIRATDANFAGKLDAGSLVVAVHSRVHERSYQLISEAGPLSHCFPREQIQGELDTQGSIMFVQVNGSNNLKAEFGKVGQKHRSDLSVIAMGKAITALSKFNGARGRARKASGEPQSPTALSAPPSNKKKRRVSPRSGRNHDGVAKGSGQP